MSFVLYHYWRSSSSWRVRWAMELKGLAYEGVTVSLLNDETESPTHLARNPAGYVPALEIRDSGGHSLILAESAAIIEWIEERHPASPLLPGTPEERAFARQLAELVNSGIQPLQNPPVMEAHSPDPAEQKHWAAFWNRRGLTAYAKLIEGRAGRFSLGDRPTYPDLFLIPQCYSALRFGVDLASEFPRLAAIYEAALATPACHAAHPDRFKPAEPSAPQPRKKA